MIEYLFQYHKVYPTTWFYLSSLLMIGLYFKFGRFWSVRNFDLILLILLGPGLLLVHFGAELQLAELRRPEHPAGPSAILELADPPEESAPAPRGTPPSGANESTSSSSAVTQDELADPSERNGAVSDELAAEAAGFDDELTEPPSEQPVWKQTLSQSKQIMLSGYFWLFFVSIFLLVRLLLDPTMTRRPLLEPNLTLGGLTFIGVSLFVFLTANVITSTPTEEDMRGAKQAEQFIEGRGIDQAETTDEQGRPTGEQYGPGLLVLHLLPSFPTVTLIERDEAVPAPKREEATYEITAKITALMSQLAIVLGMVLFGYRHFGDIRMGLGAAVLYLMLPYTMHMTGRVIHVLPGALLIWTVLCYRRPMIAGILLGLAIGAVYYPLFLLPLWISFYWPRGLVRFLAGVAAVLGFLVILLLCTADNAWVQIQHMFGLWPPVMENLSGIWDVSAGGWDAFYRIPLLAAFLALSFVMIIWPAHKNLGVLLSCSAALMVATQLWHGHGGGAYMAWYLPLLLLTVFRPNLEDRTALAVLSKEWLPRRRWRFWLRKPAAAKE